VYYQGPVTGRAYFHPPLDNDHVEPPLGEPHRCTEKIPWNVRKRDWRDQCPHDRRSLANPYGKQIWRCRSVNCLAPVEDTSVGVKYGEDNNSPGERRWVCEDHIKDSKNFWEVENLYRAHLVSPCELCRKELMRQYPEGRNTCTCRNLINRWQCRSCLERAIHRLQTHFRNRVEQSFSGRADRTITRTKGYHRNWRNVRRMLIERHVCQHCGKQRSPANNDVWDCRACGGMIVKPLRRSRRINPEVSQLWQLDARGNPVDVEGNPVDVERNLVEDRDDAYLSAIGLGYQSEEDRHGQGIESRRPSETSFKDSVVYSPPPDEVVHPHPPAPLAPPPPPPVGVQAGGRGRGRGRGRRRGRGRGRGPSRGTARGRGRATA